MMATDTLAPPPRDAQSIAKVIELSDEASALVQPELSAAAFFNLLVQKELLKDAVAFLAHWLPIREAVWWGCECVWHACRPEPVQVVDAALGSAVAWVIEPNEEHRLAADKAGHAATLRTPAGCVALAAAWTGGSLSPYAKAPVAPPPQLAANTVVAAVELVALKGPAGKSAERYLQLLRIGTEVAHGSNRWTVAEVAQ